MARSDFVWGMHTEDMKKKRDTDRERRRSQIRLAHSTQDTHAAFYSTFHVISRSLFFPLRLCILSRSDLFKHWSVKLRITQSETTFWETKEGKILIWLSFQNSGKQFFFLFLFLLIHVVKNQTPEVLHQNNIYQTILILKTLFI